MAITNNISTGNLETSSSIGIFVYDNAEGLPGVTSLTLNHTTTREGFDIENCPDLVTLKFPYLESVTEGGYLYISGCPNLQTVEAPLLIGNYFSVSDGIFSTLSLPNFISGRLYLTNTENLTNLNIPKFTSGYFNINNFGLTSFNLTAFTNSVMLSNGSLEAYRIEQNPNLISIGIPNITQISGAQWIDSNPVLTTIDVSKQTYGGYGMRFYANPSLTTIITANHIDFNFGNGIQASSNALSQQCVDSLLRACASGSTISGSFRSDGGTSSPPSAAGSVAANILINRGWEVLTN